jgi:hypothetical protein
MITQRTLAVPAAGVDRYEILPIAALLLLGSLAFVRLMALPAFEDEGSQLRWVWRIIEAGEWLQPLGDGKPLEAWPLVRGRVRDLPFTLLRDGNR